MKEKGQSLHLSNRYDILMKEKFSSVAKVLDASSGAASTKM